MLGIGAKNYYYKGTDKESCNVVVIAKWQLEGIYKDMLNSEDDGVTSSITTVVITIDGRQGHMTPVMTSDKVCSN